MRFLQNAVLAALKRVQLFLDEYAAVLAALVDLTTARKRLDNVVASFNDHAYNQDANDRSVKGETAKQRQVRVKLRGYMEPIALIARKNLRSTPEFAALQMPRPSVIGDGFLASANAMADAAAIHKDAFLAHGLPPNFLDDFKATITTLASSVSVRAGDFNKRLSATKGLDEQQKQGRLVLAVLDKLVEPALANNDPLLRGWEGARRIRRRSGPSTASSASAPTTTGSDASTATSAPATPATPTTSTTSTTPTTPTISAANPTTPPAAAA